MSDNYQKLIRATLSLALLEELHRRPTDQEFERFLRVLFKALRGMRITTGGSPC